MRGKVEELRELKAQIETAPTGKVTVAYDRWAVACVGYVRALLTPTPTTETTEGQDQ